MNLNEKQKEIVKNFLNIEGNGILVQAGPGTGKTTLLVGLIEELIDKHKVKKEEFLVLSHVNSTLAAIYDRLAKKEIHNIKLQNIKLQTIASFFIENYLIPFKEILIKINSTDNKITNFLKKVGNNFTEDSILGKEEWDIFWNIIMNFNSDLLDFSKKFLKGNSIKYILIDEYQDIDDNIGRVLEIFIKDGHFKFLIVGDKNQAIMYNNELWDLENRYRELNLIKDKLKKTYRFGSNILNEINNICESEVNECDKGESGICEIINYNRENINDYKFWVNEVVKLLKSNFNELKGKEVCILFQPTTDYSFGQNFNNILRVEITNKGLDFINFIRTEKPSNNIHLNELLLACINWIIDKNSVYYKEIEKKFLYLGVKKDKRKEIFKQLLLLNSDDSINKLEFLGDYFRNDNYGQLKQYWKEIINNLGDLKIEEIDKNKVINLEIKKDSNKINLYTSPIHSAKGKQWDVVIILDIYFLKKGEKRAKTFTEVLNSSEKVHKNIYYVALSRAKERVYTFVKFKHL